MSAREPAHAREVHIVGMGHQFSRSVADGRAIRQHRWRARLRVRFAGFAAGSPGRPFASLGKRRAHDEGRRVREEPASSGNSRRHLAFVG